MNTNIFNEKLNKDFISNYFGKQYLYKKEMFANTSNIMSLDILNNILGISSNWNNKNFTMMLDKNLQIIMIILHYSSNKEEIF